MESLSAAIASVFEDLLLRGRLGVVWSLMEDSQPIKITVRPADHPDQEFELAAGDDLMQRVQRFATEAQEYLGGIYGQPVPTCPQHAHALLLTIEDGQTQWVCPDGGWRCQLGSYDELTWPPGIDERAGVVAEALVKRFDRRGIRGWQRAGAELRDGAWVARVRVWPVDAQILEAIRSAAAPLTVEIEPGAPPASPEDNQRGLDTRHAQELEWARWAVDRWAGFPVDREQRPLVLIGPSARIDDGFRSGEAKLAFVHGSIETTVPVPEPVLAAVRDRPADYPQPPRGTSPLTITTATRSETEFLTDRGRRMLCAWRLEAEGAIGPIWVPDPDLASLRWAPEQPSSIPPPFQGSPHRSISATLARDGQTLTFSFVGAVPEIVEYPRADAVESQHAVAIVPVAKYIGPPASFHPARGRQREVTIRLSGPLGARVLVDLDTTPAEVTASDPGCG
jgi:hypothetical protein